MGVTVLKITACAHMHSHMSTHMSIHASIHMHVHMSVHMSIRVPVTMCVLCLPHMPRHMFVRTRLHSMAAAGHKVDTLINDVQQLIDDGSKVGCGHGHNYSYNYIGHKYI